MCRHYSCATPLQIVRSVKGFLQEWSYARNINTLSPDEKYYPRVVWNLANPLLNSGAIACGPNAKRQDGVSTGCSVETANPTITASLPSVKTPTGPLPTLSTTSTKASVSKNPTITASFHTGPYTLTPVSTPLPTFSKTSTKASVSASPDLPAGPPGVSTARKPTTSTTAELRSSSSKK